MKECKTTKDREQLPRNVLLAFSPRRRALTVAECCCCLWRSENRQGGLTADLRGVCTTEKTGRCPERQLSSSCPFDFALAAKVRNPPFTSIMPHLRTVSEQVLRTADSQRGGLSVWTKTLGQKMVVKYGHLLTGWSTPSLQVVLQCLNFRSKPWWFLKVFEKLIFPF